MSKVAFFYCNGTASVGPFGLLNLVGELLQNIGLSPRKMYTVAGLHGRTAVWQDLSPQNDPFCQLLDPNIFDARKIIYPQAAFPMDLSMDTGISTVINSINDLPAGTKFMLGGFSQGAAVMSSVYNEIRAGSLTSRNSDFLGGVMFGNCRRQVDYRGSVGGTWSGALDVPGSTTGGHGVFPATGPYARLTNCEPSRWIEFVYYGDVAAAVGDTPAGSTLTAIMDSVTGLGRSDIVGNIFTAWTNGAAAKAALEANTVALDAVDATGLAFKAEGGGHVSYPWFPPPGNPDNGLTAYQIAIRFLETKALESAKAPVLLPSQPSTPSNAGWSTTLIPPAA